MTYSVEESCVGGSISGSLVRWNSSTRRLSMEVVADFWLYTLITNNSMSDLSAGCIRPRLSNNLGYFKKDVFSL